MNAKDLIEKYNLSEHPEGGYFKEIVRSEDMIHKDHLPGNYTSHRSLFTTIYFLLNGDNLSHFHRLKSDEMWFFHSGSTTIIHILDEADGYKKILLGDGEHQNEQPQVLIPKGCWFAAELEDKTSYGFYSCVVSPGFDFEDFELAQTNELEKEFPQHKELVQRLTL